VRHRFAFVDDYDIAVARMFYQGADVWLNNPRRPLEACGTSGEKAALNGALNCSILDGWWDEMYDGSNGWAISSAEAENDLARRDAIECESLFDLLEQQIVPLFYDRGPGPIPRRWIAKVKHELSTLGPQVEATRMVKDYVQQMYEPAAARGDAMAADGWKRAKELATWKTRVRASWTDVRISDIEADAAVVEVGDEQQVSALVELGALAPDDVAVELLHGPVGPNDELTDTESITLELAANGDGGPHRFTGSFRSKTTGRHGFTLRVVPAHPDLTTAAEMGAVVWAG
jgi:starch phosphorylase